MCDCVKGHADCIELLLGRQYLKVNAADKDGETALLKACREGNAQCAPVLTKENDIYTKNDIASFIICLIQTVLTFARSNLLIDIFLSRFGYFVRCLIFWHFNLRVLIFVQVNFQSNCLMCDCVKGHKECVQLLLGRQDLKVNATDKDGETALMKACRERNAQCAHALTKKTIFIPRIILLVSLFV